ncbi:DUF899 domain-containing protein [Actinomadura litoris]|uniref:DUF899 domain-containing protein n=1 Tax=Actinomadura litoris TaxID=2678616 RepID=A0A7K1KY31_9ACTN|nr:DUF899 domain-containing protein [Actinomadura litoris]MUN36895.1 DUF899 domain-containing protein [Actinomadura litoris]
MRIVSREEWLAARGELMAEEIRLAEAREAVSARRRRLPAVRIGKEYRLEGPSGPATLGDLFDGRRQLVVYHFMFAPDWDEGCPHCSFQIDGIGHLAHLRAAGTSLAVVSRAPFPKIQRFKERMGWSLPWFSSHNSDFNHDFRFTIDREPAPTEYGAPAQNGAEASAELQTREMPGVSVFLRNGTDILHTYSAYAGEGDVPFPPSTYNYLDLTPLGRQEGEGSLNWVRHHDRY